MIILILPFAVVHYTVYSLRSNKILICYTIIIKFLNFFQYDKVIFFKFGIKYVAEMSYGRKNILVHFSHTPKNGGYSDEAR
jgi:hypothetical protein